MEYLPLWWSASSHAALPCLSASRGAPGQLPGSAPRATDTIVARSVLACATFDKQCWVWKLPWFARMSDSGAQRRKKKRQATLDLSLGPSKVQKTIERKPLISPQCYGFSFRGWQKLHVFDHLDRRPLRSWVFFRFHVFSPVHFGDLDLTGTKKGRP